jgi:hypothetical protein
VREAEGGDRCCEEVTMFRTHNEGLQVKVNELSTPPPQSHSPGVSTDIKSAGGGEVVPKVSGKMTVEGLTGAA